MGLFSKLFKKKNQVINPVQPKSFDTPECQQLWNLKGYIDGLLIENRYIAKVNTDHIFLKRRRPLNTLLFWIIAVCYMLFVIPTALALRTSKVH